MSINDNIIEEKKLEAVSGGESFSEKDARAALLLELIPEEVRKKLAQAKNDIEASRILADCGVDLESIEKKIQDAYSDVSKNLLSLTDKELEKVSGGFEDEDYGTIWCDVCQNANRDEFSYQFWASQFINGGRAYRCKKCNTYIVVRKGFIDHYTEEQYKNTSVLDL